MRANNPQKGNVRVLLLGLSVHERCLLLLVKRKLLLAPPNELIVQPLPLSTRPSEKPESSASTSVGHKVVECDNLRDLEEQDPSDADEEVAPPKIGGVVRVSDVEVVRAVDGGRAGLSAEDGADLVRTNGFGVLRDVANVARDDIRAVAGEGNTAELVLLLKY